MTWWRDNRIRMIQNNLREMDMDLDVDSLIETLKGLSTNTLMMNAGGIVAFYPTQLEFHYRAANQTKNLLREAVDKAHSNGMRFIARFDFSKAHERIFKAHPEWFYRTDAGNEVNYFGIVHTCVNGYYQQEYSLRIIDEVISNYDVDGIFFNMFGYQTRDYTGNYHGICQCDNCKTRFRAMYHEDLPLAEDWGSEVYQKYKRFQVDTTKEMLDRIHALVKARSSEIAISTYNEHKVDIVRKESNTAVARPLPMWQYSGSDNVKSVEDSWDDKLVSNCCINAIDLPYRFTGVSKHEIAIRLYESISSGSGLDFCIIGVFDGYPDRANFETVRNIFEFHKDNEQYFGNLASLARVALVHPSSMNASALFEYRGLFKMLKEEHIPFDVMHQDALPQLGDKLKRYRLLVVPDVKTFEGPELEMLAQVVGDGVNLVATGQSFTGNRANQDFLGQYLSATLTNKHEDTLAAYFDVSDKNVFRRFQDRDWVIANGPFNVIQFGEDVVTRLPYVQSSTFGPPERAFGHGLSPYHGLGIHSCGEAYTAYLPWQVGTLYYRFGYEDHKQIVLDVMEGITAEPSLVTTNAPCNVELFYNRIDEHTSLLQLLNLNGFNGVTYFEPYPTLDISITIRDLTGCEAVMDLRAKSPVQFTAASDTVTVHVDRLRDYAAMIIKH